MELQTQPSRWSCTVTAAAMVIGVDVAEIIKAIGHDGSEIIWPNEREPIKRRGFHFREIADVLDDYGYSITAFDAAPECLPWGADMNQEGFKILIPIARLEKHLNDVGIITGQSMQGNPHAVAWDGSKIYDPKGEIYEIDFFKIQTFWKVNRNPSKILTHKNL